MAEFSVGLVGYGAAADWHADQGYAQLADLVRLAVVWRSSARAR
jgi:hypothetical protein